MKTTTQIAALILAAAMLAACGGGGSNGSTLSGGTPAGGSDTESATQPAPDPQISVASMVAPNYTTADCPRFTNEAAAVAALDLSNVTIRTVNEYLLAVDADHAHKVFVRRPYDFVNWIAAAGGTVNLLSLGVATHETLHMTDLMVLRECTFPGYRVLFHGNIFETGLQVAETASIKIVDGAIDAVLKSEPRFQVYITNAATGNDLSVLLDEFAAYTGAAHTEYRTLSLGRAGSVTGPYDANLGGAVNFMVFLETYLQAARVANPVTYNRIRNSAPVKSAIQAIWTAAEQALRDSHPYVKSGSLKINNAYLAAAYSDTLLSELDAIGISHATAASWRGTYLP
jgi:hypothetical protein